MKTNIIQIALVVAGLFTVGAAHAKTKKPTVCMAFTESTLPVDGVSQKVAICTDGKKPVVLTSYSIQTVKDADGNAVKAAIGYR